MTPINKDDLPYFNVLASAPERQRLRLYSLHLALSLNSMETDMETVTKDAETFYKFIASDEDFGPYQPLTLLPPSFT